MTNQNMALPSQVTCLAVRLTDSASENLNMVVPHAKATAEAPATAIKRTLVGGYEVFGYCICVFDHAALLATKP